MKTKFTPGPWILDYGMVVIGDINYELDNSYDAPLIACAPDMYAMLESTCSELYSLINEVNKERLGKVHSQTETPPDLHDMETCHLIQQLLKRARDE